jgi:hypothetical protein
MNSWLVDIIIISSSIFIITVSNNSMDKSNYMKYVII